MALCFDLNFVPRILVPLTFEYCLTFILAEFVAENYYFPSCYLFARVLLKDFCPGTLINVFSLSLFPFLSFCPFVRLQVPSARKFRASFSEWFRIRVEGNERRTRREREESSRAGGCDPSRVGMHHRVHNDSACWYGRPALEWKY